MVQENVPAPTSMPGNPPPKDQEAVIAGSHLKSPADLTSMPSFPKGQDGSLLAKFLTDDLWYELEDKADRFGFTFKQAIFSGCKNTDSGIGVYAGSPASYEDMSELFVPIIEHYHQYSLSKGHVSNMDPSDLVAPPLPPEDAAMIKSTRIRVGRNLADFPLGPGISREQRL